MIEVLAPLARVAGVRVAVLVSQDGIPVFVRGRAVTAEAGAPQAAEDDPASIAALAIGWLSAVTRSIAPLSFDAPARAVLRADRGTIVLLAAPGSVLMVALERGASPDDLRLPMDGAVARMQRLLRSRRDRMEARHEAQAAAAHPSAAPASDPPAVLPTATKAKGPAPLPTDNVQPQAPRVLPG